jgi:5-(carboxyamino)imidazole ribonucleotide mutase
MPTADTRVLIVLGSESDLETMRACVAELERFGVGSDLRIASAHRAPERVRDLATSAQAAGFGVIVAAAGLAAHLPGVIAAHTTLPVIGVPIASGALHGQDALYSIAQMPPGVPVASVAIGGARNAALLAIQILATADERLRDALHLHRAELERAVIATDERARITTIATGSPA